MSISRSFGRVIWIMALLISFGCTSQSEKSGDPVQSTLKDYISRSFQVRKVGDRESMLNLLTGDAKARLAAWSDEQFLQAFVDDKREFLKLVILEDKRNSGTEANLTFELTYIDRGRNAKDGRSSEGGRGAQVTNRKLAHLVSQGGKWQIAEMKNIKELVEYRNEMTFPY